MVAAVVVLALAVVIFVVVVVVAVVVVQHGAVERLNMWCLNMFTSKCASRHKGEHFFNIPGPNLKMVRTWCAFYILTSACASRHSGVHFLNISTSKSGPALRCFVHFDIDMCFILPRWLRTRRFSEPTFWFSRATKHLKNTVFHNFSIFSFCAPGPFFCFALLWSLSSALFFSDSSDLCFSVCSYCQKFDF